MKRTVSKFFAVALALAMALSFLPGGIHIAGAVSTSVVISQVYGGGGNANAQYQNDFVELYNLGTTAVDVTGWTVQYASAAGSSWNKTVLSGTIQAGKYYLVQEAVGNSCSGLPCGVPLPTPNATGTLALSSSAGKVALVSNSTALTGTCPTGVVDFVGFGSTANCSETAPTGNLSNTTAALRKSNGAQDTDNNSTDFTVGTPNPRNTPPPDTAPSVAGTVPANGAIDVPLNSNISVTFTEAVNVTGTWFSVVCATSGAHTATVTGGPTTFTIDPGANFVGGEACTLTIYAANVSDQDLVDPPDNMTINFTAGFTTVMPPLPIGVVNGPITDAGNPLTHASPYKDQIVKVQGVIYETTLQAIKNTTDSYKGFFLQNTSETSDGDDTTSDGLFVYMNKSVIIGTYTPKVGDEIILIGKVSEYYNMTELVAPFTLVEVLRHDVVIDDEVPAVVANPPVPLADANRYWERLQGMRVQAPQDSLVLGGRNVFSPADAEIWLTRPDSTIALRSGYARKAYRDAHPLDDNYDPNIWDGNGYRILIGSLGIKALVNDAQALINPVRSYSTLANSPAGGVNYTFSKYRIEVSEQPVFNEGDDPAANNPPAAVDRSVGYTIADYNLENLYDYRDNPFSGCDFANVPAGTNPGCPSAGTPFTSDVTPAYDYVPASDAVYQARLGDIASEIVNDLHSPDILMVQEVENQDICTVTGTALTCGITDNADGKPDVLQELALKIAAVDPNIVYDAAFDRDSSDLRGIAPSYLYRTDRVQILPAAGDPVLGATPSINGYTSVPYDSDVSNPKTLNAVYTGTGACETNWVFPRAPDVGLFRIFKAEVGVGAFQDVYVINNHFKSGPDTCVAHRTEQAKYNAALVAFIQAANPEARVVVGGDLNVYPRPDDPFAPIGQAGSSDQLGSLYNPSLGLKNLWEVLLGQAPESAYSYVYLGQAQTLDQLFVNSPLLANLQQFRIAHINSDFAADYSGDVARGTSDHDPNVANILFNTFDFSGFLQPVDNQPEVNVAKAGSAIPVKFSLGADKGLNIFGVGFPKSNKMVCDTTEPQDNIEQTVTAGNSGLQYDPLTGQYTYVWKTDKTWAGTCRQLVIKFTDGNYYYANFKFNK